MADSYPSGIFLQILLKKSTYKLMNIFKILLLMMVSIYSSFSVSAYHEASDVQAHAHDFFPIRTTALVCKPARNAPCLFATN